MSDPKEVLAHQLKELLVELSPLIERYTEKVCPGCDEVCCKQKHGMPREKDTAYLTALGIELRRQDEMHPPDGPCRFLGPGGCSKERWERAWKCTWYFCGPLLHAMNEGPQRQARRISELIAAAMEVREKL